MRGCSWSIAWFMALLALAACGTIQPPIMDSLTTAALLQQKKAIAVLELGSADHSCLEIEVKFGMAQGASFKIVKAAKTGGSKAHYAAHIVEVEFDPGEIHVVEVRCQRTKNILRLGEAGPNGTGMKSLAAFRIDPGEILNIGLLEISDSRNAKLAHLSIKDLPLAALQAYKQTKPNLFAQMKTRLMKVNGEGAANDARQRELCTTMQQFLASGKIEKLPAECTDRPAPEPLAKPASPAGKRMKS